MKLRVTVEYEVDISEDVYQEWLNEIDEPERIISDMSNEDKLKVIEECEKEYDYEILNQDTKINSVDFEIL